MHNIGLIDQNYIWERATERDSNYKPSQMKVTKEKTTVDNGIAEHSYTTSNKCHVFSKHVKGHEWKEIFKGYDEVAEDNKRREEEEKDQEPINRQETE